MRKSIAVIISVLLALAFGLLVVLYVQYRESKGELALCHEKLSDFREKTARLEEENSALRDRAEEGLKQAEELKRAVARISELEHDVKMFDMEIESSRALIEDLKEKLGVSRSLVSQFKSEIVKRQVEVEALRRELSHIERQKAEVDGLVGELKMKHEGTVAELKESIGARDRVIEKLHRESDTLNSQVSELKDALGEDRKAVADLRGQVSDLMAQKAEATALADGLRAEHGSALTGLNKALQDQKLETARLRAELSEEIQKRDLRISEIEGKRDLSRSEISILHGKLRERETRIERLEQGISRLSGENEFLEKEIGHLKSTYSSMVGELERQIQKKEVTIEELEDKLSITFVDRILFDFGKATISQEGKEILTRVGRILKSTKDKKIRVVGHTDNVPIMEEYRYKFPSNWELSASRAAAVVRHFQSEIGLDPGNLEAVGRSFYEPIADNETNEGRARNRRVNIVVAPKLAER